MKDLQVFASVADPTESTAVRLRRLHAVRQTAIDTTTAALKRERASTEIRLANAEHGVTTTKARVAEFERQGDKARATVTQLDVAALLDEVDRRRAQLEMIDSEIKRWSKKRIDRDGDWPA